MENPQEADDGAHLAEIALTFCLMRLPHEVAIYLERLKIH